MIFPSPLFQRRGLLFAHFIPKQENLFEIFKIIF